MNTGAESVITTDSRNVPARRTDTVIEPEITSTPGRGTRVCLRLPTGVRAA